MGLNMGSSHQSCGSCMVHVRFMLVSDDETICCWTNLKFYWFQFLRWVFKSEHAHLFDSRAISLYLVQYIQKSCSRTLKSFLGVITADVFPPTLISWKLSTWSLFSSRCNSGGVIPGTWKNNQWKQTDIHDDSSSNCKHVYYALLYPFSPLTFPYNVI